MTHVEGCSKAHVDQQSLKSTWGVRFQYFHYVAYLVGITRLEMLRVLLLMFCKSKVTVSLKYVSVKSGTTACINVWFYYISGFHYTQGSSGFLIADPKAPEKNAFLECIYFVK